VEDFRQVVDYLVTLPYVDSSRIGVLGICGGGGYAISAAKSERRIKAVVSITGVTLGASAVKALPATTPLARWRPSPSKDGRSAWWPGPRG
jgi:dienelactone hydrolase